MPPNELKFQYAWYNYNNLHLLISLRYAFLKKFILISQASNLALILTLYWLYPFYEYF